MLRRPKKLSKTRARTGKRIFESKDSPIFRGNGETISSLNDFIEAVQEQKDERLTPKQTKALTKVAESLISFIKAG